MAGDALTDLAPTAGPIAPEIEQTVGAFSFHLDGGKLVTSNKMGREINDEVLERWKESGFIAGHRYVKAGQFSPGTTYRLSLSGHQEGESSILLQIVSGLSLMVLPYYVDTHFDLDYSLENAETGCTFSASVPDSYNTVVGLVLLPASPFAQGGRIRTFDRIANHVYDQLSAQGAFEPHPSCREEAARPPDERLRELEALRSEGLISDSE